MLVHRLRRLSNIKATLTFQWQFMFVLKKSLTLHNDLSGNLTMKREFYHFAIYFYLENYLFVCGTIPSMFIFDLHIVNQHWLNVSGWMSIPTLEMKGCLHPFIIQDNNKLYKYLPSHVYISMDINS